jgi:hypothetical protein
MRFVQEVKGTKIVWVNFLNDAFFDSNIKGFKATYFDKQSKEKLKEGFDKVAKIVYDNVVANNVDGIDFDHEPCICGCGDWNITYDNNDFGLFIEAISKYFDALPELQQCF